MAARRVYLSALVTAVGGSLLATVPLATPARADLDQSAAAAALDLPAGVTVSGLGGAASSRALADASVDAHVRFNDFPSKGDQYLLLSSGDATKVFSGAPTAQLSTDLGDDEAPDSSSITLTVAQGTVGAGCLFVDFAFGTEEALGKAPTAGLVDDGVTIVKNGTDYAVNAGSAYFAQDLDPAKPGAEWPDEDATYYRVNSLKYWHKPGDPLDPIPGTAEDPRLAPVTGLNNVTTKDTARVPLDVSAGAESVTITVEDAPEAANGDLDSVAFLDHVRLGSSCGNLSGVEPGAENRDAPNSCCGIIRGIRGVGNALVYDPVPTTSAIERYDDAVNGWQSPSNVPVELRFRWYRALQPYRFNGNMTNWDPIPNADRQTYVPTAVDRGKVLIVLVTGVVDRRRYETFPSTNTADTWYVTLPIENGTFVEGEAPVIRGPEDGSAAVGETLTAQIGNTVPRQDTYNWQWYSRTTTSTVWSPVSGASGQSLVIGEELAGRVVMVRATARRDQFDNKSWDSVPYGPVELQSWTQTDVPSIVHDGTPQNGETLTVAPGSWSPEPASYSYQWRRDGQVISGATSASYPLKSADVGFPITVDVAGVKTGYPQVPRTSSPVTPSGQIQTGAEVTISGTPKVGARLTGSPGAADWVPAYPTMTYSWWAGDVLLQQGTKRTYDIDHRAVGKEVRLEVTARKTGYEPMTEVSDPTATVAKGTITPGTVRISGYAKVGYTLRASKGYWRPSTVTYRYRWKIGSKYVSGAAGKRSYLKIPRSARGKRVVLVLTVSKYGYTTVTKKAYSSAVKR